LLGHAIVVAATTVAALRVRPAHLLAQATRVVLAADLAGQLANVAPLVAAHAARAARAVAARAALLVAALEDAYERLATVAVEAALGAEPSGRDAPFYVGLAAG
jgi:hypothetical protein